MLNMNLFNNKGILRKLLLQSDMLNTINGGTASTSVKTEEKNGNLIITVSAPSLPAEAYNIILNQNNLIIFSVLTFGMDHSSEEEFFNVPFFTKSFALPINIESENIEAIHENGELRVIIPLLYGSPSQSRRINIKQI